jgi:hypothetical protein
LKLAYLLHFSTVLGDLGGVLVGKPAGSRVRVGTGIFPKKERDPNAMDVDRLTIEERNTLMKEGKCFKCRQFGHLSRDCKPGNQSQQKQPEQKKWGGREAFTHIQAMIASIKIGDKSIL